MALGHGLVFPPAQSAQGYIFHLVQSEIFERVLTEPDGFVKF
jgi:hypothetical protein